MKVADFQMWDKILPDDQLLKVLFSSQNILSWLSEKKKNCYCSGDGLWRDGCGQFPKLGGQQLVLQQYKGGSLTWQKPVQNVLFIQNVFLPTWQAETYLKICVLIYHLTYIFPSLFGWKENMIFEEAVILTDFECSKKCFLCLKIKKRQKFYGFHPKNNIGKIT